MKVIRHCGRRCACPTNGRGCAMLGRIFVTLCGVWLLPSWVARADGTARPTKLYFESGSRKIRADCYSPVGTRSHRAVIVLYGAGGMVFDGPSMKRVALALADAGDTVYLLHYY